MKQCNKCQQNLSPTEFYKNNRYKDGLDRRCKKCQADYKKERKVELKSLKTWYVYYLPKEGYYGHTYDLLSRMTQHRLSGRNTLGYRIVETFTIKEEALAYERKMQGKEDRDIKTVSKYVLWDTWSNEIVQIANYLREISVELGYTQEWLRLRYKANGLIWDRYKIEKMYYDTFTK